MYGEIKSKFQARVFVAELMKEKIGSADYEENFKKVYDLVVGDAELPEMYDSEEYMKPLTNCLLQSATRGTGYTPNGDMVSAIGTSSEIPKEN